MPMALQRWLLAVPFSAALLLAGCAALPRPAPAPTRAPGVAGPSHPKIDPASPVLPAAGSGRGAYYQDDGPGEHPPANLLEVPDAVVKAEPLSKYANRPYVVFGKTYTPLREGATFAQRGMASWYGKKFHGQRTSSGELYDMYKMTAAHPTLPIPSYARITSRSSGQQVIVRINDRGPFHASRIVDVSYTAALKLGLLGKGSHDVDLERLLPGEPIGRRNTPAEDAPAAPAASQVAALMLQEGDARAAATDGYYLQLGAFIRADKAAEVRDRVLGSGAVEMVEVVRAGLLHRLYGGPFGSRDEALTAARSLPAALAIKPIVVRRSAD
jgi:rare lipoprotein A